MMHEIHIQNRKVIMPEKNLLFHKQEQVLKILKISCLENDALFMHQIGMSQRNIKLSDCFLQLTSLVHQTIYSYVMAYIITIDLENIQICVANHLITHNEEEFKTNRRNRKLWSGNIMHYNIEYFINNYNLWETVHSWKCLFYLCINISLNIAWNYSWLE